ncbi:MAG: O-antigen ligase family protein [bacterium]|nr:O-antigen ligase family protein [bacterium]
MSDPGAAIGSAPKWLVGAFLALLILPFSPHWVDFEQVRRGLLLTLTGAVLLALPRLPRVHGEPAVWAFLAFLGVAALISTRSLQPWEAWYRIAHFGSLFVVLRLGAAGAMSLATPLAALVIATAVFGITQRLDLANIGWYGTALEPVAVLGNLNVASEWMAIAVIAVAVLPTRRQRLTLTAIGLAGCYLVVNGSRSGMVAAAIGFVLLTLMRRRIAAVIAPGILLLGAGIGLAIDSTADRPPAEDFTAEQAMQKRATHTLEVRYEIARGCTELLKERPLFGFGPGQFQVQYPRVRSAEEIDLSSQHRKFASEVRTAHDDWLELLVEGGLPLVFVFAAMLFALQRGQRDKERLVPLFVLLLLMLVRSPLGNAPAIATALLPLATAHSTQHHESWRLWLRRALGLLLLTLGTLPIAAHMAFAPYLAAIEHGETPRAEHAATAHQWMWWEPRWLQVLAMEHAAMGNAKAAQKAAAMALELRPHDPELLRLLGTNLSNDDKFEDARQVAEAGLRVDPHHPELRVLRSISLMMLRRYDEATTAVTVQPHEVLRAQLVSHFKGLERVVEQRGDPVGAARCRLEHTFLSALETINTPRRGDEAAGDYKQRLEDNGQLVRELLVHAKDCNRLRTDLRPYVIAALHAVELDDLESAIDTGNRALKTDLALPEWQRDLLADKLAPLLELEPWFELLRRRS